jgi:hypothetical protein
LVPKWCMRHDSGARREGISQSEMAVIPRNSALNERKREERRKRRGEKGKRYIYIIG